MADIVTQEPTGAMAGELSGPLHAQAPPLSVPMISRVLHPDEQLHRNQSFYVPTVQPLFPYQWSMSNPYVPYGGFHGLGYGMMPLLPPCLEVPGYMIPQAQLPLLDYRRMTPHVAPNIAHQTRRSHFRNSVSIGRVMVSSEVQTEPLCHSVDSHGHAARSQTSSESGRGTGCGSPVSTSPCSSDNKSVVCPEGTSVLTQNRNATNSVHKSEIIQAERVQIKCSEMPSGLKIFQNMELTSHNETDLLQCSLASLQSSEDVFLCSYQSLALKKDKQKVEAGMLRYSSRHSLPTCTEVTVARTPPSCRTFQTYHKQSRSVITQSIKAKKKSEIPFLAKVKEDGNPSSVQFKILRLPFDIQNHNRPCQLEASIWSVESLRPYVPSNEWMVENGFLTPQKPLSPQINSSDVLSEPNQSSTNGIPIGKNLKNGASTKYHGLPHQLEASIWSVESLRPYVPSNEWMVENGFLTPQKTLRPQIKSSDVLSELNQSFTNGIPVGENLQTGASTKCEDSLSSLKAHSPYRPSTSWLADFGNVYYYSKLPIVRQQPNIPERVLPKMSLAISLESSPLKNRKETRNQRAAIGVSDQKHNSCHTCECKAKNSLVGSAVMRGSVSHSTLERKLPFCPSCRYDTKGKDHRKLSFLDGLGWKREEIAEVKTYDEKSATEVVHNTQEIILGSRLAKCRAAYQPKIRDQTGLCENCQCLNASPAQDTCVDLECRIWEKNGKDWNINPKKSSLQRLQKDNAWTGSMQATKTERIQKKKERKEYLQELTRQRDTMHTPWRA